MLATGGFASGGLALDSRWQAREAALGLPVSLRARAGEPRFVPGYFDDQPMARAGLAVDDELRPLGEGGEPVYENVRVAGASLGGAVPWKEKSGDGISLASGHRAAELIARDDARAATHGGHMSETATGVLGELMRGSLDHCVKCTICETQCPFSNATPLFPGPKYVGPQAERFRVAGEPSPDASLDYCSGCGICTQVCPQGVHIAEINTQARAELQAAHGHPAARPRARAPDARRPARDAGRAAGQLDAAQQAAARASARRRSACTATPRCRASPGARSRRWARQHARARGARSGSPSSTAAGSTTTSRGWAR